MQVKTMAMMMVMMTVRFRRHVAAQLVTNLSLRF